MHKSLTFRLVFTVWLCLWSFYPTAAQNTALPFGKSNVVIYDNDDHRDTYTDELLLSLADARRLKVVAFITNLQW